jgi:hypothetical protein
MRSSVVLVCLAALACACAEKEAPPEELPRCLPGAGATGSPRSIGDAVELINSLDMPVTAECFVESLDRPLALELSESLFSAQPAVGARSPRVFLFYEPLILSIVPEGRGRNLVEFGEQVSETRTLKGEIAFPVDAPLDASAPFERILFEDDDSLTGCAFCHADEDPSERVEGGFESQALQPLSETLVAVDTLVEEEAACDPGEEEDPSRCAYLTAVTAHGAIEHHPFPEDMDTFE